MHNKILRKGLVLGIIVLFLGTIITPTFGISNSNDDNTPPVSTYSLDPPIPDGDNSWYISDVNVTLTATGDMSGVKEIYYRIDKGEWINCSGDYVLFLVDYDCLEGLIEFYSVDFAGNQEEIKSFNIDMDQLPPELNVKYDKKKINDSYLYTFNPNCWDNCSGINRVEYYLNGVLQDTVTGPGPEYTWSFLYSGGLKFTIKIVVCDNAGNCISSDVKINIKNMNIRKSIQPFLQFLKHFPILHRLLDIWRLNLV